MMNLRNYIVPSPLCTFQVQAQRLKPTTSPSPVRQKAVNGLAAFVRGVVGTSSTTPLEVVDTKTVMSVGRILHQSVCLA